MLTKEELALAAHRIIAHHCRLDCLRDRFELSLAIMDDRQIAGLNRAYRQQNRPTDVLSFPQIPFPPGEGSFKAREDRDYLRSLIQPWPLEEGIVMLGDTVISFETAFRQARERGESLRQELLRLLIHGILHLFGYDHETGAQDQERMEAREELLLMPFS